MNSGKFPLPQLKVPASIITPPIDVPFPVRYLVKEWITMLAPCSIGFNKAGEATVLSTTKGTLASFAASEIDLRSITSNLGLPKDSAKNRRVLGSIALVNSSGLSGSTKVVVMPNRGNVFAKRLYVPP